MLLLVASAYHTNLLLVKYRGTQLSSKDCNYSEVKERPAKVENGTWPAEDSVPTEGSRKSCQAEKSGERKIDDMFDADSVLLSGWQLEA